MKSTFAVLCLLGAFWTIDATPILGNDLERLRLEVRQAKRNVDDIIRQLQILCSEAKEDTIEKVSEKWEGERKSYRSYKTLLVDGIKKDVNAATTIGKDVKMCYEEAVDAIEQMDNVVLEEGSKCNNNAENAVQNALGFIDNLVSTGDALSLDLDGIFLTCFDNDINRMQSCVITDLARIKVDIRTLQSDANSAEVTVAHVSNNVVLQATNCLKKAYSSVYSKGDSIKTNFTECVEKAEITTTEEPTTTEESTTTEEPTTTEEE
ncbi:uncharacterized protein LOC114929788 [Nylanderia fulva]|uniref:uncharacterized protein LOC114929788 n=1 Tax=Nylanderia fulva TaxID=613905 RepID=UPI0010FB0E6E|nr:uncharacterized protein LOC114929788 [Nylanderia fulva]